MPCTSTTRARGIRQPALIAPELAGAGHRRGARTDAELGEDVHEVGLHGRLAEEELPADLAVRAALGDEREHLGLARGEALVRALRDRIEA